MPLPDLLHELDFLGRGDRLYDVTPDGQRLALVKLLEEYEGRWEQTNLVVVENWLEELSRLAPRSQ